MEGSLVTVHTYGSDDDHDKVVPHHATYVLQCGVWRATCRVCKFEVSDQNRRQAAALFRHHVRDAKLGIIDLVEPQKEPAYDLGD